jgi:3D (Asp-Asp-Asp) domain-containing protein
MLLLFLVIGTPIALTYSKTSFSESVKIPTRHIKVRQPVFTQKVAASVYFPSESQTDDSPRITADGSRINKRHIKKQRWLAVSRNLLRKHKIRYGDSVYVSGINDELDGYYEVHDTMNKRLKNTIDILVGPNDNIMGHWKNVQLKKYKTVVLTEE